MKAVVMAGGEGARLRPLTSRHPKPLVPVVGTPVLEHVLRLLRHHGVREVVITIRYLGAEIRNWLGDGSDLDMEIHYAVEEKPLGTAGSVRNAAAFLDDTFLVLSGDALTDFDLTSIVREHRERKAKASIVLVSVPNPLEYGVVLTHDDGSVRRFIEKPSWGEVVSDHVNTGIYVMEPEVLDLIAPDSEVDWSGDVFPRMLRQKSRLHGIVVEGYWSDIGSVSSYLQANWDALEGRVNCHISGRHEGNLWIGEGVEFGLGVQLEGPAFIGDEVKLKGGAFINGRNVIDRFSTIDDHAKVSSSIIWPHSYVGERCRLRHSILCRNVTIKNDGLLEDGVVVGDESVVGQGSRVKAGVKIWPHKEIEPGSTVTDSVIWAGEWRQALFSSHGLSGLINVELTPELCARMGATFAATLAKGATVGVSRDHARSSRMIKRALIAGLASAGACVLDLDELPVPVTQFAIRAQKCAAGVHVLVSGLDQRSADIRFFDGEGLPIDKRAERKIENLFFREDFRRVAFYEMGEIEYHDPVAQYRQQLLASIDQGVIRAAQLRVLVDYDYSMASAVLPEILATLDVNAIPLNAGLHEGVHHKEVSEETALISRTVHADLGCKLNPSGERLTLIDDAGDILTPYETMAIAGRRRLQTNPGTVVGPATTPAWMASYLTELGGTFVASAGDISSVSRAATAEGVRLASDGDGGFIWPDFLPAYDALYSLVKLLEMRALDGTPLSQARQELPASAYVTATEFCPWEAKGRVMRVLTEQHEGQNVELVDGVKVYVDSGFVMVRPDPDVPAYHIVASVADERMAQDLVAEYSTRVREAQRRPG